MLLPQYRICLSLSLFAEVCSWREMLYLADQYFVCSLDVTLPLEDCQIAAEPNLSLFLSLFVSFIYV